MKLCIPIAVKPEGGVYTFVGNLTRWLERQAIPFTASLADSYDVLFANSWLMPAPEIARLKRQRPELRVVHRVDGSATDYGGNPDADRSQARVNLFADATIFQSEYSRFTTREKFRVIAHDGPVIFNPVDLELFAPGPPPRAERSRPRVVCTSWSVNPRKGTWQIDRLAQEHPDVDFVLCGRFPDVQQRPNTEHLGYLDRERLASALRHADAFLNLSENEACPNVVIEALASGIPVLFVASGGVPELVGDCGEAMTVDSFRAALSQVLEAGPQLKDKARRRAVRLFDPDVVFPKYLSAIEASTRSEAPSLRERISLARSGYPVFPRLRTVAEIRSAIARRTPALLRRTPRTSTARVGWITYDSYPRKKRRFDDLDSFTSMRVGQIATWMNAAQPAIANELYDPRERYDVVVFQKMMNAQCQDEAARVRAAGGKVVFDANVNYYEIWGDYIVAGTRPTEEQQRDARAMTAAADWVVADSSYLERVIKPINPRATWIPDNVNTDLYRPGASPRRGGPVRLIWSGIGKKAAHLLLAVDAFAALTDAELVLVVDEPPSCLPELERAIRCSVVKFSHDAYAKQLAAADIIVSPKMLVNAYEMGHTEYKITLGMACALPAVASPQPSYLEAINAHGGGIVADSVDEWKAALIDLVRNAERRAELGARARNTVVEKYSTAVVGRQYLLLLEQLIAGSPGASTPQ